MLGVKRKIVLKQVYIISVLWIVCSAFFQNEEYTEIGKASYYNDKFHGRKTSSGELLDQNEFTAAHKTLPFGTVLKVTNLSNDSIVYVKVNDRLSKSSKHIIDVTKKAAKDLDFMRHGITKVLIQKL